MLFMDIFNIYNKNVHIHGNDNFQIVVTAEEGMVE